MKTASIESVCECQAKLGAVLDEQMRVIEGWARDRRGNREQAPAQPLGSRGDFFEVGFSCPFCTRNTLRSFHAGALSYRASTSGEPAAPDASATSAE